MRLHPARHFVVYTDQLFCSIPSRDEGKEDRLVICAISKAEWKGVNELKDFVGDSQILRIS